MNAIIDDLSSSCGDNQPSVLSPAVESAPLDSATKHDTEFDVDPPQIRLGGDALVTNGYVLVPGLTAWLQKLNPLAHEEAWQALGNPVIGSVLTNDLGQRRHFFLNDEGEIDSSSQLSIEFRGKPEKSYITVVEGSQSIVDNLLLPNSVKQYLQTCLEFLAEVREYFADILPASSLPALLKLRVFDYHASDPLVAMRPPALCPHAMRPHVDGSICTLVIAASDGLLRLMHGGKWRIAGRTDQRPFALLMPGIAAAHDLGVAATPHMVLPGIDRRVSVTVFLTPDLGSSSLERAEFRLREWRFTQPGVGC